MRFTTETELRLVLYYGGSCTGYTGKWFLNAGVSGPNKALKPSYHLHWTFTRSTSAAAPTGVVYISPVDGVSVTEVIGKNGVLTLSGKKNGRRTVTAHGSLRVALVASSSGHSLRVTETGLSRAEASLGLVSPFDLKGAAANLRVRIIRKFPGC
ncbi:MAG: hypothetical protein WB770_04345 [Acidimicrobiales bacterium]